LWRFPFTSCPIAKQQVRGNPSKLREFLGDPQVIRTSVPIERFPSIIFLGTTQQFPLLLDSIRGGLTTHGAPGQ
ncbi:unnamed protein product, partial [Staurois parvus]